jgi:hypothetical protein
VHVTASDLEITSWSDQAPALAFAGHGNSTSVTGGININIGDGSTTALIFVGITADNSTATLNLPAVFALNYAASEGHHTYWFLLAADSSGTASVGGTFSANVLN